MVSVERPRAKLVDRNGKDKWIHLNHVKRITYDAPLGEFRGRGRPRKLGGKCDGGVAVAEHTL